MTVVWIITGIILFLLVLSFMPLSIRFSLGNVFFIRVTIAGIPVFSTQRQTVQRIRLQDYSYKRHQKRLLREKKKQNRKMEKENKKTLKQVAAAPHTSDSSDSLNDRLHEMIPLIGAVLDTLPKFFGRMESKITRLSVIVGGSDAAQTALHFGILSQSAAYLLEILNTKTRLHPIPANTVQIRVDYCIPKIVYDIDFTITFRPVGILHSAVEFLCSWIRRKK